jgi:hypothetical protein
LHGVGELGSEPAPLPKEPIQSPWLLIPTVRIVGATEQETANIVSVDKEQETHVRCGADILLSGMYQDVRGEAVCPVCGTRIRIVIKDARVTSVTPRSALLHYVVEYQRYYSICCSDTFIFHKQECLRDWLKTYRGRPGLVQTLPDFMREALSRRKLRAVFSKSA